MLKARIFLLFLTGLSFLPARPQQPWKASWIAMPGTPPDSYGIYLFRKSVQLSAIPTSLPVYVSADNRYKLFVNDSLVSLGPARGDIAHWKFATVDLAPWLRAGMNNITAQVWNEGRERQEAQLSFRTGFILQGATPEGQRLNTDTSWQCTEHSQFFRTFHCLDPRPLNTSRNGTDPTAPRSCSQYRRGSCSCWLASAASAPYHSGGHDSNPAA